MNHSNGKPLATLDDIAPKLAEVSRDVLFGDIWERTELSKRDRSLITVAALAALYRPEQLPFHLEKAVENELTRNELVEVFTHLAFYAGWPAAVSALNLLQNLPAAPNQANVNCRSS